MYQWWRVCVHVIETRVLLTWWRAICSSSCSPLRASLALALLSSQSASWTSCSRPDWWFWRSVLAVAAWSRGKQEKGPLHFLYQWASKETRAAYSGRVTSPCPVCLYYYKNTVEERSLSIISRVGEGLIYAPGWGENIWGSFAFLKLHNFFEGKKWGCQRANLFHIRLQKPS